MKKILIIICLLCLVGCNRDSEINKNDVSAYTEKVLLERMADETKSVNNYEIVDDTYVNETEEVDCYTIDECINHANIIQNIFASVIANVSYLKNNSGYQINYEFRSNQFDNFDECMVFNNNLTEKLGNKISSSICDKTGKIEIVASDTEVIDEEMVN